jgi:hypothetical protein
MRNRHYDVTVQIHWAWRYYRSSIAMTERGVYEHVQSLEL